jgi:hypothetical protein
LWDFTGPWDYASTNQPGIGNGVMGRAVGPLAHQAAAGVEHSGHAVDLRSFQRFFKRQRRQDGRHALGQHGFA